MKVMARCCDDKPIEIEIKEGEKKGFICEKCNKLFDVNYNGIIAESPLNKVRADVTIENRRNVCTGFGGQIGRFLHQIGKNKDPYK